MSAYSFLVGANARGGGAADTGQQVITAAFDSTGVTIIFLGLAWSTGVSPTDIVDSKGNVYFTLVGKDDDTASTLMCCLNPTGGSGHTIQVNGTNLQGGLSVMCFTGGVSIPATPTAVSTSGASDVNTIDTGSLTTTAADQMLIAHCALEGGALPGIPAVDLSVDSPFTAPADAKTGPVLAAPEGRPNYGGIFAYQVSPSVGAHVASFDWTGVPLSSSTTMIRMNSISGSSTPGEIKTRNVMEVNPSPVMKARNGLARADINRINLLTVNGTTGDGTYSVVAVEFPPVMGFNDEPIGYDSITAGGAGSSITPTTFNGVDVIQITSPSTYEATPPSTSTVLGLDTVLSSSFISGIILNGYSFLQTDATFFNLGGQSFWLWSGAGVLPSAGTYDLVIIP